MASPSDEPKDTAIMDERRDIEAGVAPVEPNNNDQDIENEKGEKDDTNEDSKFIVWWNQPTDEDPDNPMNWSSGRKWGIIATLSSITFLTPLASSMFAPGVPQVIQEFHETSQMLATFVVSVFVLGFAFGPLLLAPLSEIYGRTIIYHVTNVFFLIFTIGCAVATDMGMLVAFRFLAGFAGVAVITCGSGSIADMMPPETRGRAMAFWSLGPLLGPMIGPIAGGFMVESIGWRWVFWVIAMVSGVVTIVALLILRETYPPVLLERKAARLRKETGDDRYRSKLASNRTRNQIFMHAIARPTKMFLFSPIVCAMCVYIATMYGLLYILFTTFTFVYEELYGFSSEGAGLSFIGSGVGTLLGLFFVGALSDRILKRRKAAGHQIRPEDRLPLLITVPAALTLPLGLIMYGWTAAEQVHWVAPMIGTGIMGFGMIAILMCIQTYLVDAYTVHAASVTAANAVLRSLLGALLPLCGLDMYDKLGIGWGNCMLGLIALALAPVPWLFGIYGERIRTNPRFRVNFE